MDKVLLDLETTGGIPKDKEIIEVAAIKQTACGKREVFQSFVRPKQKVEPFILRLTHIREEDIKNAPRFIEIYEELQAFLRGSLIIAHNVSFDISMLNREAQRINKPLFENVVLDSADLSLILMPCLKKQGLKALANAFKIDFKDQHRAMADVECLEKVMKVFENKMSTLQAEVYPILANHEDTKGIESWMSDYVKPSLLKNEAAIDYSVFCEQARQKNKHFFKSFSLKLKPQASKLRVLLCPSKQSADSLFLKMDQQNIAMGSIAVTEASFKAQLKAWKEKPVLKAALLQWWQQSPDCGFYSMHGRLKQAFNKRNLVSSFSKKIFGCEVLIIHEEELYKHLSFFRDHPNIEILSSTSNLKSKLEKKEFCNVKAWPTDTALSDSEDIFEVLASSESMLQKIQALLQHDRPVAIYCRSRQFKEKLLQQAKEMNLKGFRDMSRLALLSSKNKARSLDVYLLNEFKNEHFGKYKNFFISSTSRNSWMLNFQEEWQWFKALLK